MQLRLEVARQRYLFGCLLALFAIASSAFGAETTTAGSPDIRVMSFNVRFAKAGHSEDAPENNWTDPKHPRRERTIRVIRAVSPDLLGVQEARSEQIDDLKKALPEYEFYGIGRDDGKLAGEFSGVFYWKERFTRKDAGSFWLSATPEKPGTTFYGAANAVPRIASWVKLGVAKTGREVVVLNQHWDHIDVPAREKSAALVRERLAKIAGDEPTIVMGDLNSNEDTVAFATLLGTKSPGRVLADSYRELYPKRMPNEASFDGWKGTTKGSRIDFILHTDELAPVAAGIDRTNYDGLWPSDHYPVTATLRFTSK